MNSVLARAPAPGLMVIVGLKPRAFWKFEGSCRFAPPLALAICIWSDPKHVDRQAIP